MKKAYKISAVRFPSFYLKDFEAAVDFYTRILGPPETDQETIKGWQIGDTWLTLFPAGAFHRKEVNPRNCEIALQVESPDQVDSLYRTLVEAGAESCWEPEDTEMYVPMRFSCVDDPFGIRIDVYCPLEED